MEDKDNRTFGDVLADLLEEATVLYVTTKRKATASALENDLKEWEVI